MKICAMFCIIFTKSSNGKRRIVYMKKTQKIFFRVVGITVILSVLCAPLTNAVSTPVAGRSYRERTLLPRYV